MKNWGGNLSYGTDQILEPTTIDELSQIIKSGKVRPIGTKHSFSPVVIGDGKLVSTMGLVFEPFVDEKEAKVTVAANTRFGDLAIYLESRGWALKNMGSLPHISIAGACATGTHGSGDGNQILSASLSSYSFLDGRGEMQTFSRGDELFEAGRLGLGAYGLWVQLTLDVVPSYRMRQDVYHDILWEAFYENPANLTSAGYSVSLFTKWGKPTIDQTWVKTRISDGPPANPLHGVYAETESKRELAPGVGDNLTAQGGQEGAWCDRLPHFRLDATPSAGDEIQTEYFVQRDQVASAVKQLNQLAELINPILIITEIRTIASDQAWLSPMLRGDSVALHFTWRNDPAAVNDAVQQIEAKLGDYGIIPHWGKVNAFDKSRLAAVHSRISDAREVFDELDPMRKFSSEYLVQLGVRSKN
jgi:alditol oxidase